MSATFLSKDNHNQLRPVTSALRLLIVSDSDERLRGMRSALGAEEFQVTEARAVAEVRSACREKPELAVIDAGAADVVAVLKALRGAAGCEGIPVLIDINGLSAASRKPGVLPRYRAMPCAQNDLLTLIHCYLRPKLESRYDMSLP
jgi:PleD family two-component response regulator